MALVFPHLILFFLCYGRACSNYFAPLMWLHFPRNKPTGPFFQQESLSRPFQAARFYRKKREIQLNWVGNGPRETFFYFSLQNALSKDNKVVGTRGRDWTSEIRGLVEPPPL